MLPDNRNRPPHGGAVPRSGWRATDSVTPPGDTGPEALTFDDLLEAERRREQGTRAAELNTYTPHRERFVEVIRDLAAAGAEFSSDDVLERVGHHPLGGTGALGAIFQACARSGIIEAVGFVRSRRPERHGGFNRTWRGVVS